MLAAIGLALACVRPALAQSCCASGASLTPIRLDLHERGLVGVQLGGSLQQGSFDRSGRYRSVPPGASDVELRQTAFATLAPWSRLQLSAMLPWVETRRTAAGAAPDWGTGMGDISLNVRAEPVQLREFGLVPGLAVLASAVLPTGRPAERAQHALGADATGAGMWRLGGGLALEQTHAGFIFNVTTLVSAALPRTAAGMRYAYAPRLNIALACGYALSHTWHSALLLMHEREGAPSVNGQAGSARQRTDASLLVTRAIDDDWRMQAALTVTPPLSHAGRADIARTGATLALVRSWL